MSNKDYYSGPTDRGPQYPPNAYQPPPQGPPGGGYYGPPPPQGQYGYGGPPPQGYGYGPQQPMYVQQQRPQNSGADVGCLAW